MVDSVNDLPSRTSSATSIPVLTALVTTFLALAFTNARMRRCQDYVRVDIVHLRKQASRLHSV